MKIPNQNLLDIVVSANVGRVHPNQFKAMFLADPEFLILSLLCGRIGPPFMAVQLYGKDGNRPPPVALVYHKIEALAAEKVGIQLRLAKQILYVHPVPHNTAAAGKEHIVQSVIQIFQKGRFRCRAVWLDSQRTGSGGLFRHLRCAVAAHILHQFVEVVIAAAGVQPLQLARIGKKS